jgi:cobalt-precorrin 5A hydrolase/precorrin-3B C17-methyltransferase
MEKGIPMKHPVVFAGAGPGAVDLVTLRCQTALSDADLVVYAGSLVNPKVLDFCRTECRRIDSAPLSLNETTAVLKTAFEEGKRVVRLHTGDPAMYGAITEQMNELDALSIPYEVIPGVSSVFAAAATLRTELTSPGVAQSVILTRTKGRTPMPESETPANFVRTGATLVFFLSAGDYGTLTRELIEAGCPSETPAAIVYRASWPDENVVRGVVNDIAGKAAAAGITRQALLLVGAALARHGTKSKLYDGTFSHGYRNEIASEAFDDACALYAMTAAGVAKAAQIAAALPNSIVFAPERFQDPTQGIRPFRAGELSNLVAANWNAFGAHIFLCACGIAVRTIAPFLRKKSIDPAIVVCDETGSHAISLAGGHLAGANRLSRRIARITGGEAIITTATDIGGLTAFDELAAIEGWRIENPDEILRYNAALLEGENIHLAIPETVFRRHYAKSEHLFHAPAAPGAEAELTVLFDPPADQFSEARVPPLVLRPAPFVLGIGCRRGVEAARITEAFARFASECGIRATNIRMAASCERKRNEPGLLEFTSALGVPIRFYSESLLTEIAVPSPSAKVREKIGTASVCEAAAILASGGPIAFPKRKYGNVTFALATTERPDAIRPGSPSCAS